MRIARVGGRATLVLGDALIDIEHASDGRFGPDLTELYDHWSELGEWAATRTVEEAFTTSRSLQIPVELPRQVFAIGANYADHVAEAGASLPEVPLVFTKFPTCIAGPRRRRRRDPPALRGKEPCVSATRPLHVLIAGGGLR